jgi:repressor of nif and glnA expression
LGIDLGERAVRYHLKLMDERGLTRPVGRKDGRVITKSGIEELDSALISDRVGLVTTRISKLAYQSSFDPEKRTGEVPINVSLISTQEFSRAIEVMKDIFLAGLGISDLVAVASEGEQLGEVIVPPGKVGLATVSHVVVYGALLRVGILVDSRFGGILQIRNQEVLRFVDLIEYSGCSLDPSEVFISGKMTSVSEVAREGNGKILASFCEIPAIARSNAEAIIKDLEVADIKSLVMLGRRGEPVYQLPVAANRVGMVLADGLNPVAAAVEAGTEVINHPMSGSIDFGKLEHFKDCQSLRR